MSSKRVIFDFWHINDGPAFASALTSAQQFALASRTKKIGEYPMRFESIEHDDGMWTGEITKFREDVVPNRASRTAPKTQIQLRADESTTEDTAFGYHAATNTLITQANHYGSSAPQIVDYFNELVSAAHVIYPDPILDREGWQRLAGLARVTKFVYAFALPPQVTPDSARELSVEKTIDIVRQLGGRRVRIEVSVGRSADSLLKEAIQTAARVVGGFITTGRRKPKLEITGRDADGKSQVFDLLEYRIREPIDIDIVGRRLPYANRKAALRRAFRNRGNDLS